MIAVDAAAPYLFQAGIIPHIVVTAEEQAPASLIFNRMDGWFPGVCLVASTTAHPLGLYMCAKLGAKLHFYNSCHMALAQRFQTKLMPVNYPSLTPLCGSVTFHAVALAGYMGVHHVGLIGADFHVEDHRKTHAGAYHVEGIPIDAMNQTFQWHQRELEQSRAALTGVWNCTDGGMLAALPRQRLETFLSGTQKVNGIG